MKWVRERRENETFHEIGGETATKAKNFMKRAGDCYKGENFHEADRRSCR